MPDEEERTEEQVSPGPDEDAKADRAEPAKDESEEDFDADRAKATIKAQREAEKAAKAEARKAARERDEALAKLKEREDADLSELERAQARATELEEQAEAATQKQRETALRYEVAIAAGNHKLHDPAVAYRLIDLAEVEYDDDGSPSNVDALVQALVKEHPYLAKGKAERNVDETPGQDRRPPSDEEIRNQAGSRLFRPRL